MEIGVIVDLDSLPDFKVPEYDIDSKFSIAILSTDIKKAEEIAYKFNTDNIVAVEYVDRDYILEVAEDATYLDRVFIVSNTIQSHYSVHDLEMLLN